MDSSHHSTDTADARFVRIGAADAKAVARLREEFSDWLRTNPELDDVRFSDVLLAVYEALSNAAEFAYANSPDRDTMTVQGHYSARTGSLTVTVVDQGQWRQGDPGGQKMSRGRGIPLMRALADQADIEPSAQGTQVRLRFDNCAAAAPDTTCLAGEQNGNSPVRDGRLPAPALRGDRTIGDQVRPGDGVGAR